MGFKVAIPARYASTRLPGKPLRPIHGRIMLEHVWDKAVASGADEVVIATDDERIGEAARAFGARVCMTAPHHPSGTDRLAELVDALGWADETIVVNLQGDEPLMPPALLRQVAEDLETHPQAGIATVCSRIVGNHEVFDPNVVKVVTDVRGYALYFSRAPVPWHRDGFSAGRRALPADIPWQRHAGLYAYRAAVLRRYPGLPSCPLEQAESLEQLRALWNGIRIHVRETPEPPPQGVDTEADLRRVEELLAGTSPAGGRPATPPDPTAAG